MWRYTNVWNLDVVLNTFCPLFCACLKVANTILLVLHAVLKIFNIKFSNCIIYFLRRRKHFFIVHNFKSVPKADTVKHAPFSVETVKMSCNVISSMDFVLMVVHLVGWVIDVTKVSLIPKYEHISKYLEFNHVEIKFKLKEMKYLIFWPIWAKNKKQKTKTSSMIYLLVRIFGVLPKQLLWKR